MMEEMLEREASGDLTGAETWFAEIRPGEELYDLESDPHEVDNLADDPDHAGVLERMRGMLDDWRDRVDDAGDQSEAEMIFERYRGDDQPQTAPPRFVPNAPSNREREVVSGTVELEGPATLSLYCATQGASLGYTIESGEDPHWRLYDGPVSLPEGETTVRAKAIRYGYRESEERSVTVTVSE
jgi:hypothetical protein